jgi:PPOX class probable F420-dependent enzyme
MTPATPPMLPASHVDLIDRPLSAVLTTEMPDGRLQSTVVWYQREAGHLLINTMREFQKARNLAARPRATVLVIEPGDANRWIEVRARAVADDRDPAAHLDALARRYTGTAPYFGAVVPVHLAEVHPRRAAGSRVGAGVAGWVAGLPGRADDPGITP